jgi:hypothetical protein
MSALLGLALFWVLIGGFGSYAIARARYLTSPATYGIIGALTRSKSRWRERKRRSLPVSPKS